MKKLLFVLIVFLFSFDLMGQVYEYDLKERYDSIPAKEWNHKFITAINVKFDSLVKEGVDSIMVYYYATRYSNFALLIHKGQRQNCSIAYYQYIPNHTRLGSEILSPSVLDSTNILAFYSIFRNREIRTLDSNVFIYNSFPVYGKFYFGKSAELYAGFEIFVSARADREFQKAYIKEEDRILDRENEIYKRENK